MTKFNVRELATNVNLDKSVNDGDIYTVSLKEVGVHTDSHDYGFEKNYGTELTR